MATKTGYKQAVVVYKVSTNGEALDINGDLISDSGRKQAIALLSGASNPNVNLYEVEIVYPAEASIDGTPTVELSDDCAGGVIIITPAQLLLTSAVPSVVFLVYSQGPWVFDSGPVGQVTLAPTTGGQGQTNVTVTRTSTQGQGLYVFRNTASGATASIYIVNVDTAVWILETGAWNDLGLWTSTGIWNY